MWSAMLASLRKCYGCRETLVSATQISSGFCGACRDRSHRCTDDELGGEG